MIDQQMRHYGDIAAVSVGGGASLAFWTDLAQSGTIFLTFAGALLSVVWLGWRLYDRAKYGPAQTRDR